MILAVSSTPTAETAEPWRSELGRRLARLTVALTIVAFVPIALATTDNRARVVLIATGVAAALGLLYLGRVQASVRKRSLGIVSVFVAVGTIGYATFGFLSGPGVAYAAAVAFSGLLLGRRAMHATILICSASAALVGVLMVNDWIPSPLASEIAPTLARSWIRSGSITLIMIMILGAAVTQVVENTEASVKREMKESERRRLAELQVLQAHSTHLIGELAASLAHDVNNLLTVIGWWSGRVASGGPDVDRQAAHAAISDSINQAASLTQQMLMLGRRDSPTPVPVRLADFIQAKDGMLQTVVRSDVELIVIADDEAWCRIDPSQLGQVLLNLVVNARDAMPHGGQLSVAASHRPQTSGAGIHGPIPRGDWSVLSVSDTGSGMDEQTRRRAFEPFFTTKLVGEGNGLGLATIAVIVDQADGHVVLDTGPDRGTLIELWLPSAPSETPASVAPASFEPRLDGIRVLVAEDSVGVLSVARQAFEDAGAIVTSAADGDEALIRALESSFDLLCTDVVMPGAPTSKLIATFEAQNPQSAVLLCSGYVGEDLVRRGIEDGSYELLQKPYTAETLVATASSLWARACHPAGL